MAEHRWSETQLGAFQTELTRFNLLSDYTNAVRRVVLANIETWRTIAEAKTPSMSLPQGGGYVPQREWAWQPRVWWYDNSIQLYYAGRNAIDQVDVPAGRVSRGHYYRNLRDLPLDNDTAQLIEQANWWGANSAYVSFAQTAVNQAVIACALERRRVAHGAYPETLDQLLPDYLGSIPPDVIRGRPMYYERTDKGSYLLRGAGPNGVIDQGKTPSDDWLWSFPAGTNTPPSAMSGRK
jgi:hypothetical protein